MGKGAGVSVYSNEEVKRYCIARSYPACRALLRFIACPMHTPLNIEL